MWMTVLRICVFPLKLPLLPSLGDIFPLAFVLAVLLKKVRKTLISEVPFFLSSGYSKNHKMVQKGSKSFRKILEIEN